MLEVRAVLRGKRSYKGLSVLYGLQILKVFVYGRNKVV